MQIPKVPLFLFDLALLKPVQLAKGWVSYTGTAL